jgi:hypothetical protein
MDRMNTVADGFAASLLAADALARVRVGNPAVIRQQMFDEFVGNLEPTYLIRLFAVFESGLRDFWSDFLGRSTRPDAIDLLKGIALRQKLPADVFERADEVREHRNWLVHENRGEAKAVTFGESSRRLAAFFSRLPKAW